MCENKTITLSGYLTLPAKRILCPCCDGDRVSSEHLGAFTSDEMHEQGQDFKENYFSGRYDQQCTECEGKGYIEVVDIDQLTDCQHEDYQGYIQAGQEIAAIEADEARWCA